MRARIKAGRLLITRGRDGVGRVTQYRLPKRTHVVYGVFAVTLIFLLANPVVMSLLGQVMTDRHGTKLMAAARVTVQKVSAEAKNVVHVARPPVESGLPTCHLHLPNNTLQKMHSALVFGDPDLNHEPGGTKPYFRGILQSENPVQRVKICLRGTMHWHHRMAKPSFRIKIRKSDVRHGDRYIELTTPEDSLALNNLLPMRLAANLDLMNDASRHVRLFINKKYFGVYVRSIRPGEPFALANGRMPGTFFKAEFSEKMWEQASAWKTFGQEDPLDIAVMQRWLDILAQPPTAERIEQFHSIFDSEKFARWAALMTVVGSIHTDDRHNHSYFFCSNQGKLEPMPWDCNGYGLHTQPDSPVDVQVQPVLRFLACDPRWVHRRNQWIRHLIDGTGSIEEVADTIDQLLNVMRDDMKADRNLGDLKKYTGAGWNWMPSSVADTNKKREQLLQWIDARNKYLTRYLNYARFTVAADGPNEGRSLIRVFGNVAIDVTNNVTGETRTLYPGTSKKRWLHTSHQQQAEIQFPYLRPAPCTWQVAAPQGQLRFRNAITGDAIVAIDVPEDRFVLDRPSRTIPVEQFRTEPDTEVVLGPGPVELKKDLVIQRYQTLTVLPGTHIALAAGVGIYSRGLTRFTGTLENPIRVSGSQPKPWAAIGISGPMTRDSIFEHVEIDGGSVGKLDELRFKGMLNVYNCPRATLRHCRFGANHVGDDAVNLAESSIHVADCRWSNARADALDLDMCHGTVTDCQWIDSGNDGLDLMSCNITVRDSLITGSGDKGISVGENTRLKAENVVIADCAIGTEIKDDSIAQFTACQFDNCHTAVHSYQKKWFYAAGGTSAFVDCQIHRSHDLDVDMQSRCNAMLIRTVAGRLPGKTTRIQKLGALPDDWDLKMQPKPFPMQREAE